MSTKSMKLYKSLFSIRTRELEKEQAKTEKRQENRKSGSKPVSIDAHLPEPLYSPGERQRKVRELVERKDLLAKALRDALEQNQRLLKEAKRRRSMEKQCEEERSLTEMLSIISEAVTEVRKEESSNDDSQ